MPLYHGDRIINVNPKGTKLEFGRVQVYYQNNNFTISTPSPRTKLSKLADILNTEDYKISSGFKLPVVTTRSSSSSSKTSSPQTTAPLLLAPTPPQSLQEFDSPVVAKSSKSLTNFDCYKYNDVRRVIVWDGSLEETEVIPGRENNYKVIDRKFSIGQRVMKDGRFGRVVEVMPLVTVKVIKPDIHQDFIIADVEQPIIQPLSRKLSYRMQDNSIVLRTCLDSFLMKNTNSTIRAVVPKKRSSSSSSSKHHHSSPKKSSPPVNKMFGYPFSSEAQAGVPFVGKIEQFSKSYINQMLYEIDKDKENQKPSTPLRLTTVTANSSKLSRKRNHAPATPQGKDNDMIDITVVDSEVTYINVQWTGHLPDHLAPPPTRLPPSWIRYDQQVKLVKPLYTPPNMYLDKNQAPCQVRMPVSSLINKNSWSSTLNSLPDQSQFQPSKIVLEKQEGKGVEQTDKEPPQFQIQKKTFTVMKHMTRHKYKVLWDKKKGKPLLGGKQESEIYFGTELEPDPRQEHKLCLGLIHSHLYVTPKKGSWMDGLWDYGVVIGKADDESVIVEWLQVDRHSGCLKNNRILKCKLVDIDKHPKFNELHEGRIVVKSRNAVLSSWKICQNFIIGTILSVQRFSMGQIIVHCPLQNKSVELWPHMLELFVGFTMQELIQQKTFGIGVMKLDIPVLQQIIPSNKHIYRSKTSKS